MLGLYDKGLEMRFYFLSTNKQNASPSVMGELVRTGLKDERGSDRRNNFPGTNDSGPGNLRRGDLENTLDTRSTKPVQ